MIDPQKKARDDDRDAAIEVVEAAFADGQISRPDYDLRVDRLLRAATVGELQMLVRDLRRPEGEEVTEAVEQVTEDVAPERFRGSLRSHLNLRPRSSMVAGGASSRSSRWRWSCRSCCSRGWTARTA